MALLATCLAAVALGATMALGSRDRSSSQEPAASAASENGASEDSRIKDSRTKDSTASTPAAIPSSAQASVQASAPAQTRCYVGVLVARGDVDVTAKADGTLVASSFAIGDVVQQGQQIALVRSFAGGHRLEEQAARLEASRTSLRSSEVEVERARRELSRRQGASQLFSIEQIEAAKFQLEIAELDHQRQQSTLKEAEAVRFRLQSEEKRGQVLAPFTGRVSGSYVLPGTSVRAGQAILRLVATEDPVVRFAVPAAARQSFAVGTQVRAETASGATTTQAVVETIAPILDEASQLIFIEASTKVGAWREVPMGAVLRVSTGAGESCRNQPVAVLPDGS